MIMASSQTSKRKIGRAVGYEIDEDNIAISSLFTNTEIPIGSVHDFAASSSIEGKRHRSSRRMVVSMQSFLSSSSIGSISSRGDCEGGGGGVEVSDDDAESIGILSTEETVGEHSSMPKTMNCDNVNIEHSEPENITVVLSIGMGDNDDIDDVDNDHYGENGEAADLNLSSRFTYSAHKANHDSINSGLSIRSINEDIGIGIPMGAAGITQGEKARRDNPSSSHGSINTSRSSLSLPFSAILSSSTKRKFQKQHHQQAQQVPMTLRDMMFKSDVLGPIPDFKKNNYASPNSKNSRRSFRNSNGNESNDENSLDIEDFCDVSKKSGGTDWFYNAEEETTDNSSSANNCSASLIENCYDAFSDEKFTSSLQSSEEKNSAGSRNISGNQHEDGRKRVIRFAEGEHSCPELIRYEHKLPTQLRQNAPHVLDIFNEFNGSPKNIANDTKRNKKLLGNLYTDKDEESSYESHSDEDENRKTIEKRIARDMFYSMVGMAVVGAVGSLRSLMSSFRDSKNTDLGDGAVVTQDTGNTLNSSSLHLAESSNAALNTSSSALNTSSSNLAASSASYSASSSSNLAISTTSASAPSGLGPTAFTSATSASSASTASGAKAAASASVVSTNASATVATQAVSATVATQVATTSLQ